MDTDRNSLNEMDGQLGLQSAVQNVPGSPKKQTPKSSTRWVEPNHMKECKLISILSTFLFVLNVKTCLIMNATLPVHKLNLNTPIYNNVLN